MFWSVGWLVSCWLSSFSFGEYCFLWEIRSPPFYWWWRQLSIYSFEFEFTVSLHLSFLLAFIWNRVGFFVDYSKCSMWGCFHILSCPGITHPMFTMITSTSGNRMWKLFRRIHHRRRFINSYSCTSLWIIQTLDRAACIELTSYDT